MDLGGIETQLKLKQACDDLDKRLQEARDLLVILKTQGLPGRMKTLVDRTRVLIVSVQQNVAELNRLRIQHVAALERKAAEVVAEVTLPEGEVLEKADTDVLDETGNPELRMRVDRADSGVEYYLADGRGPYSTIQEAMDVMGLPKDQRPRHNRWDRLSGELKKAIIPRPKVAAGERRPKA